MSEIDRRYIPEEMKPFKDYSAHQYRSKGNKMGIMIEWYHGNLNGLPFKWPLISWPEDWDIGSFEFYNQDLITKIDPALIIFTEDEASADVITSEGTIATTIPCLGLNPSELDWSQFKGKDVIVWPDNYCRPSNHILEIIRLINDQAPKSLKILAHTTYLPENWNAALMEYEAEDGDLMNYASENLSEWPDYEAKLDANGEFPFEDFWFPKFPAENHPDIAYIAHPDANGFSVQHFNSQYGG